MTTSYSYAINTSRFMTYLLLFSSFFFLMSFEAFANNKTKLSPRHLVNSEIILQVEFVEGKLAPNTSSEGIIVQTYINKKMLSFTEYNNETYSQGDSYYKYRSINKNIGIEKIRNNGSDHSVKTIYTFNSPNSGTWERTISGFDGKYGGQFIFNKKSQGTALAPSNHHEKTLVLSIESSSSDQVPADKFPSKGSVVFQSYKTDGTYEGYGFGAGTVDHNGTYQLKKISSNILIEQTLQTIPAINYTAPYTMLYTYNTPYSGTWYQNYANGLIIFSGTFITFDTIDFKLK